MQQKDPLTGEMFTPKRTNQIFATKLNQIRFNNQKAYTKRKLVSPYNSLLETNRKIIIRILNEDKTRIVSRDYLLGAGYNMGCFVYMRNFEGKEYFGVYEYGITKLENGRYELIKF